MAEILAFPETVKIDRERMQALAERFMVPVAVELTRGPPDYVRVLTILNALAVVVTRVLDGTGNHPMAVEFFEDACAANRNEGEPVA